MNVTDIDDKVSLTHLSYLISIYFSHEKIIKRARERYLMKKYVDDNSVPVEKVVEDCQLALKVKSNNLDVKNIVHSLLACERYSST